MATTIFIGTSGWSYPDWKELFYPKEVKSKDWLSYYANHFATVELNNTFYHLPTEKSIQNWYSHAPQGFIFAVKASQYITHLKRLTDPSETTRKFFDALKGLKDKLGPILFQLPPSFKQNLERLHKFIRYLPPGFRYVFEFRHDSWYQEDTYDLLKKYGAALCITDLKGKQSPEVITADFTYLRLHGPKLAYQGEYGPKRLQEWKKKFDAWHKNKIQIFCYFDNDAKSDAIKDAFEIKRQMNLQ